MPGLIGIVNLKDRIDESQLERMIKPLLHEEDYIVKTYTDNDLHISVSRIETGILDEGEFPYKDDDTTVFFSGELYNDDIFSISPASFISKIYKEKKEDFLRALRGCYSMLLYDHKKRICYIATDRNWYGHLFYTKQGNTVYFSPEIKGLLQIASSEIIVDPAALSSFITCGIVIGERSFFRGFSALPGGRVLCIKPDKIDVNRWWKPDFSKKRNDKEAVLQEEMEYLLTQAVDRRIRSTHSYGIALSGGWDSRGILGLYLNRKPASTIKSVTWGYDENKVGSDGVIARQVAEKLGIKHTWFDYDPNDFPHYAQDFIRKSGGMVDDLPKFPASLKHFDSIRRELKIDVLLHGDMFYGYNDIPDDDTTMYKKIGLDYLSNQPILREVLNKETYQEWDELNREVFNNFIRDVSVYDDRLDRRDYALLEIREMFYGNAANYYKQIKFMCRNPGMDEDLVDFACSLPPDLRRDKALFKKAIVSIAPQAFLGWSECNNEFNFGMLCRTMPTWSGYLYSCLLRKDAHLSDYLDLTKMKDAIDDFLKPQEPESLIKRTAKSIPGLLKAYRMIKPMNKLADPVDRILFRLLSLQLTLDEFLR